MIALRMLAVAVLLVASASGAFAADGSALAVFPLGLKVCLVGAALGAAVERLRAGE